jgi:hypothetical protein
VGNEPQLAFERAQPAPLAKATIDAVHYTAEEIERQFALIFASGTRDETSGRALIFSSDRQAAARNLTPTLTLSFNTLQPHTHQRTHRHNSAAITLVVQGEECHSMVGDAQVPVGAVGHAGHAAGRAALAPQRGRARRALPHRAGRRPALPRAHDGVRVSGALTHRRPTRDFTDCAVRSRSAQWAASDLSQEALFMQRRSLVSFGAVALAGAATLLAPFAAQAQAFPSRPVKLVIAFPAGGPTDITMRQLADNASKILGQPVIVDNKPGAGGTLPAQRCRRSGRRLHGGADPAGRVPAAYTTKINWDPVKDISYVINVTGYAFGIVVPADSPLKTWKDFVDYAKANPGKLSYGSTGTLTSPHLTTELIAQQLGIQLQHMPYKGSADLARPSVGGHIMAAADSTVQVRLDAPPGRLRSRSPNP